ncbi:glycerophosphodiester phosphodiesterase [Erythrobacter sp. HL-111]|uniref:glycerophosphodiester phosphodiesterase n=1 Tax=Erythrobacter sp. HL-111 TaxID=1798193 RepID=UPI0006DA821D|nr:glycerophosphodiester phosphodiesterase [Erythrobacter sp. HL-111]KPP94449.1 MAG: glycerophosphoryl diester phosphodiesterase [Erythrobacteraceae bacterium HL-111]SDS57614.1 glycerophosphoryl diester phosphodiesterase [Erythrobacter sp. HL-111]
MVAKPVLTLALAALAFAAPAAHAAPAEDILIIAHRGASGERPEHTLAAYERAIDQGADYIEPDLVVTKDLVLVARHETELSDTTDVASRSEFEDRRRTKDIEGRMVSGWFAEDFTLAELRSLRVRERMPAIRPANARFDGLYQVPTFEEIVTLVRAKEAETGRRIGLYPELKHPTLLLEQEGIDSVDLLVRELRRHGLDGADARVFVQIFEVRPLQRLNKLVDTPLVLLISSEGGPYDEPSLRWADMMSPSGLAEVAQYADGIGPFLGHVLRPDGSPTGLVADAHAAGLKVHPWTLRKENGFLPAELRAAGGPEAEGRWRQLFRAAIASGADGFFTDNVTELVELLGER